MNLRFLVFAGVFLLAGAVRIVRYHTVSSLCVSSINRDNEISYIAKSIASAGEFANPYGPPTGPTAHHAPVFPWMVSLLYRLPPPAYSAARIGLNIFFSSLACAAVFLTGFALRFPPGVSLFSALLVAVLPQTLLVEMCNDQEASLIAALTTAAIGITAIWIRGPRSKLLLLGFSWGLVLLAAPVLVPIYAIVVLVALVKQRPHIRALGMVLATCAVLMPWIIRNRIVLGEWFFVRDTLGLELRVSNADNALADANLNSETGAMQNYHPFFNAQLREQIRREGEPKVYSRLTADAIHWIKLHPGEFARLTAQHAENFWLPVGTKGRQALWRAGCWLLATAGMIFLWKQQTLSAIWLLSLVVLYPLPYYFMQSFARYAYPVDWAVTLLAVYGAHQLALSVYEAERRKRTRSSPEHWSASTIGVATRTEKP